MLTVRRNNNQTFLWTDGKEERGRESLLPVIRVTFACLAFAFSLDT